MSGHGKPNFGELSVLIVDDETSILRIVEHILKDMGFGDINTTRYPQTALDLIWESEHLETPFDFVICDWMMPDLTGIDMLRAVRERGSYLPFIMLTAKATEAAVVEAQGLDVDAYIAKPFTPDQVRRKVGTIARRILNSG